MLAHKKIFYNYFQNVPVKRELHDLQAFLETANEKKDHLVADVVGPHKLANASSPKLIISRMLIAAILCFALADFRQDSGLLIAPLFLVAGVLSFTQQSFADKLRGKNTVIEIMAAIADKAVILPVLFYSLITYNKTLLFLLLFAEIINALVSLFALDNHMRLKRNIFSETKTSLQYLVLGAAALLWPASPNVLFVAFLWLSLIFMAIGIIVKTIEIKSYYEARKSAHLQHTLGQEGGVKTA